MIKKKTLKKQKFSLKDIQSVDNIDISQFKKTNPSEFFKNRNNVAMALFEALLDNDTEAYLEILQAYIRINKSKVANKANLSRSTVYSALTKRRNPNLKTIAKIIHHGSSELNLRK